MTKINVYDIDADALDRMADDNDESIADVVGRILEFYQDSFSLMCVSPIDEERNESKCSS